MLRGILLIGILLFAGCSDTTDGGGSAPDPVPTTSEPVPGPEPTPEPEPTDPETTQTQRNQPSVRLPSAPIGGSPDVDGAAQCAPVNWLGRKPLPEGTKVTLGSPRLKTDGVFELDQSACGGQRACPGVVWSGAEPEACYVGARQLTRQAGNSVTLVIEAVAGCETEQDCRHDYLMGGAGGSQIEFTPNELEPEPEPSPTPTEETPTDEPEPTVEPTSPEVSTSG